MQNHTVVIEISVTSICFIFLTLSATKKIHPHHFLLALCQPTNYHMKYILNKSRELIMSMYRRFSDASISEKILDTMFLLAISVGTLFAIAYIFFTHAGMDGKPGLSVEDIRIAYYGSHQQTRLGAALNGPMAGNLPIPEKRKVIFKWIEHGQKRQEFEHNVAPILNKYCIMCHSAEAGLGLPRLTSYDEVKKLTQTDTGASIQNLVRVSHIHLFGISFILFLLGRLFLLCEMPVLIKRVTVAIPFLAMLIDILSWFATKAIPGFAYAVVIGGGLMLLSIGVQASVTLYQMWFYQSKDRSELS